MLDQDAEVNWSESRRSFFQVSEIWLSGFANIKDPNA